MKKTTLFIALLLTLSFQAGHAWASDAIRPYTEKGESGHFRYSVYNNRWLMKGEGDVRRVAITGLSPEAKGDIVIPSSLDGIEVYGIDESAFKGCDGIKSITIPKSVRFLKPGTLNHCWRLQDIHVVEDHPDFASVDGVMFDKAKTKLLAIGSGRGGHYEVPDTTTAIGQLAFSHCTDLTRITIPESVTDIGGFRGSAFLGCIRLDSIDIPDSVTNIGQKSFQDCGNLEEITIPPSVTAIPFGLFWKCGRLTRVTLPEGINSIGNYAFADCTKLSLGKLPDSLTKIGASAFKDCKALKDLSVPAGVTSIGNGAFRGSGVILEDRPDAGDAK